MKNVTLAVPVLLLMCTISASNGVHADDSNFTVDSGNQESTYKSDQKPPDEQAQKDDDSHDRSENDAGHGTTNQSTDAGGDVLIDQSTYKNREKPVYVPPAN